MMALVPGVSTICMSRSISTGAVRAYKCCSSGKRSIAVPVPQDLHRDGRRRHPFLEDRRAEQGVDERALAGVELADDDQQEQFVELTDRLRERGLSFLGGARTRQHHLEIAQDATLVSQQPFLLVGQNSSHGCLRANP